MPKVVVLGAGFAGCTIADLLKKRPGYEVMVIEGDKNPGGGCFTQTYGGHPYTFGPRIFYTPDQEVHDQLTKYLKLRHFYTKTVTYVEKDRQIYQYPILAKDIERMPDRAEIQSQMSDPNREHPHTNFEEYWQSAVGLNLYNKFMLDYSKKMWGIHSNRELVTEFKWVNKGTPIRWDNDERLYRDQLQGYPEELTGYNNYFFRALEGTETLFGVYVKGFDFKNNAVVTDKGPIKGDVYVNTLHIDAVLNFVHGRLRYMGREFIPLVLPVENALPEDCTWVHYAGAEKHTRVVEFKKITGYKDPFTLLGIEFPVDNKGRYYPVQTPPELTRYEQYKQIFPKNFHSIGRLGTFRYKGIEDAIRDALDLAAIL